MLQGEGRFLWCRFSAAINQHEECNLLNMKSVICLHLGRLPVPPEYLPDPPELHDDYVVSQAGTRISVVKRAGKIFVLAAIFLVLSADGPRL